MPCSELNASARAASTSTAATTSARSPIRRSAATCAPVMFRGVALLKKIVDLCSEAGAEIYCGANYCAWKYFTGQRRTEDEWKWAIECYREVAEYTWARSDLLLAIETLNRFETYFLNLAADALRFVEEVGMPNVKVLLDTFHMNIEE